METYASSCLVEGHTITENMRTFVHWTDIHFVLKFMWENVKKLYMKTKIAERIFRCIYLYKGTSEHDSKPRSYHIRKRK